MKNNLLRNILRMIPVLLFYLALFFYAVVFNNSSGWALFFFLTFLLAANFISLIPSHKKLRLAMIESSTYLVNQSSQLAVEIYTDRPLLLPLYGVTVTQSTSVEKENYFFLAYTGNRKVLTFHWVPTKRGFFSELPVSIHSTDFLKLISKQSVQLLTGPFPVLPKVNNDLAEKLLQAVLTVQPNFYVPFGNRTFMIRDFREHQVGDPLRMIDWKQSSKRSELIVKEYEQEQEQETCILFYGQAHTYFEELLSIYYSVTRHLNGRMTYRTKLLADYSSDTPEEYVLAALQPFSEEPEIPFSTNKKLLIFAPEQTEKLQEQLQLLARTNEILLVTTNAGRLCLHYKDQVIYIDTMEVGQ
ncbi:DUF58 domain-containing protein [Enterococcus sp. BWM-S5]|uniref:DUF58 domain-containing protein n=1 Tax=Enterococcus larvae TaxID=2794352 RepID=A0ABS4CJ34_9ENTE|nr:DUF58 domain-containing protein [Enterococcus larvae]MBP1046030.1 DUF58 domain-containing protein [Enterococcus larvae]